jgi:hypothetical protein
MNTTAPLNPRPLNDTSVAATQRTVSKTLSGLLSPLEVRLTRAFGAYREKPLLRSFCNIFERHLKVDLDQQSFVWSDTLRLDTKVLQAIETAAGSEEEKNAAVFWLILFHTSYFALGYQNQYLKASSEERSRLHAAFTQGALHHMQSLGIKQPANASHWERSGYSFKPIATLQPGPHMAEDAAALLAQGALQASDLTVIPSIAITDLNGCVASLQNFSPQSHETFAQELLNDWVAEFTKTNDFGSVGTNGIRLMYFKANPPRDASEAIMDCLRSKYPVADDLALYHNRKLANDYFAPKKADPIEEKTGHIELFIDCSGSVSAGDIGDCIKVFTDFFARRKKKMTYAISCFDTSILSRITVGEEEDPVQRLAELAIVGGGGTDFRCIAAKIQELQAQGDGTGGNIQYRSDLAVVFTDLAGSFPETVPCEFAWVTTTRQCNMGVVAGLSIPGTVIYL